MKACRSGGDLFWAASTLMPLHDCQHPSLAGLMDWTLQLGIKVHLINIFKVNGKHAVLEKLWKKLSLLSIRLCSNKTRDWGGNEKQVFLCSMQTSQGLLDANILLYIVSCYICHYDLCTCNWYTWIFIVQNSVFWGLYLSHGKRWFLKWVPNILFRSKSH